MLVLRDLENFSTSEIAAILNRKEATIRWRLAEARNRFQALWERRQERLKHTSTDDTSDRHDKRRPLIVGADPPDAPASRRDLSTGKSFARTTRLMNCKQAQQDIALFVGQDLDDPRDRDDVKRHVAVCPDCRQHYRRMKGALKVLGQADAPETYTVAGSLWPELARRINDRASSGPRSRFNGWAPFVAMTAACLTLMVVVNEPQKASHPVGPPTVKGVTFPDASDVGPLFRKARATPHVRFEERTAGDDRDELQRDAHHDGF